ncbi:MAG: hypothetical protein Q9P01_17970 [Anaerolineae bacterium]|nr:hypothetical protein [Anaerolineae bacterium]MDQ7036642.1 hypothetical protein [Anaerolineae bacterium]
MKSLLTALWLIATIIVGCTNNSSQLTLEANYAQVGTQVDALRVSATVQSARARTTIDFITTRSAAAATQSQFLEATLVTTGFAPELLANFREQQLEATPTAALTPTLAASTSPQDESLTSLSTATPLLETATATLPAVSPFAPVVITASPIATQAPFIVDINVPYLENAVLATGVGADDCALGVTSQFSTSSLEIYIVAEAVNVPAGSVIESRWFSGSNPVGPIYNFTTDFDIDRACIWFFVDPTDFEFTAGQYSVDLLLNGQAATPRLSFSIVQ